MKFVVTFSKESISTIDPFDMKLLEEQEKSSTEKCSENEKNVDGNHDLRRDKKLDAKGASSLKPVSKCVKNDGKNNHNSNGKISAVKELNSKLNRVDSVFVVS